MKAYICDYCHGNINSIDKLADFTLIAFNKTYHFCSDFCKNQWKKVEFDK